VEVAGKHGRKREALEIFKLNASLYPDRAMVYDGVAQAYEANGERELDIRNYKRSLEPDPGITNGVQHLKQLDPGYK
jgi:serine-type D-Ala-D-Ala carboxypeptidase/endopeptidase